MYLLKKIVGFGSGKDSSAGNAEEDSRSETPSEESTNNNEDQEKKTTKKKRGRHNKKNKKTQQHLEDEEDSSESPLSKNPSESFQEENSTSQDVSSSDFSSENSPRKVSDQPTTSDSVGDALGKVEPMNDIWGQVEVKDNILLDDNSQDNKVEGDIESNDNDAIHKVDGIESTSRISESKDMEDDTTDFWSVRSSGQGLKNESEISNSSDKTDAFTRFWSEKEDEEVEKSSDQRTENTEEAVSNFWEDKEDDLPVRPKLVETDLANDIQNLGSEAKHLSENSDQRTENTDEAISNFWAEKEDDLPPVIGIKKTERLEDTQNLESKSKNSDERTDNTDEAINDFWAEKEDDLPMVVVPKLSTTEPLEDTQNLELESKQSSDQRTGSTDEAISDFWADRDDDLPPVVGLAKSVESISEKVDRPDLGEANLVKYEPKNFKSEAVSENSNKETESIDDSVNNFWSEQEDDLPPVAKMKLLESESNIEDPETSEESSKMFDETDRAISNPLNEKDVEVSKIPENENSRAKDGSVPRSRSTSSAESTGSGSHDDEKEASREVSPPTENTTSRGDSSSSETNASKDADENVTHPNETEPGTETDANSLESSSLNARKELDGPEAHKTNEADDFWGNVEDDIPPVFELKKLKELTPIREPSEETPELASTEEKIVEVPPKANSTQEEPGETKSVKEVHKWNFAKALRDIEAPTRRRSVVPADTRERVVVEQKARQASENVSRSHKTSESSYDEETSDEDGIVGILGKENNRAEARLAARRQARVEAREIRMREIERVQKEQEENADKVLDLHGTSRTNALSTLSPRERPTSTNSYHSSRRSSEDSVEDGLSLRDIRHELKEVEEKFRKAMIANAQLDNEKAALTFQVELLKDRLEELEEAHSQLGREHREKCREHEALKRAAMKLKEDLNACTLCLEERDQLITDYGLVIVGGDIDEKGELTPRTLISSQSAQFLESAGEGSLDVRLKTLAKEKNELVDEVRHLKLELEEERNRRRNEKMMSNGPVGDELQQTLNDYRFKLQIAEQDTSTLQATVARLESQVIRYKSAAETSEKAEDELKVEKRKLQREHRESIARIEELETENSHLQRRMDKLKNAKSALLKEL